MSDILYMENPKSGMLWKGISIEDYSRKELYEIIRQLARDDDIRIRGLSEGKKRTDNKAING